MTDEKKLQEIGKVVKRMHAEWKAHHDRLDAISRLDKRAMELPNIMRSLSNGFLDINDIIKNHD